MARLLQSSWFVALVGGFLYLAVTATMLRSARLEVHAQTLEPATENPGEPSWNFRNPEFEQWVEELKHERETLNQRAQQLQELQQRLEAERQEILAVTQAVHQLQVDFDKNVVRLKEQDMENIKKQAKVISAMSPEGAAAMLNEMPEDQTVAVLFTLKPDISSLILDTMSKLGKTEAKRAAALAERMRVVLPPAANSSRASAN